MMHLGSVALCLVAIYYAVTRLLPQLLSWFLVWRYNLQISLGRIGLHPLCVHQPSLEWGPIRLAANWVTITSSLVNSQVHRPLALCLHGVQLTQTGAAAAGPTPTTTPAPAGRSSASALLSLGQFAGLYVYQAGAEWAAGGRRRARVQAARITLEGTNTIDNGLMLVLRAAALRAQLDAATAAAGGEDDQMEREEEGTRGPPPLARLAAELEVQATVQESDGQEQRSPPTPPQLTDVSVRLVRPDVLLSGQLVPSLLAALSEQPRPGPPASAAGRWRWLAPRLPAVATLSFSELALSSLHGDRRLDTRLGSCRLEASCAPQLTEASASLKLEELSVETDSSARLASLANLQLSVQGKALEDPEPALEVAFGGHTLQLTYSHEAVSDWLTGLGLSSLCRRPPPPPPPPTPLSAPPAAGRRWRLRLDAELWDVETCLLLPALPPVSTCLTHGKLGGTPAAGELVLETLTCCLGTAEPAQRRHVPGAVLVLGALLVNHRRAADGAPAKLGLLLENLQLEASEAAAALAQFAADSVRRLLSVVGRPAASVAPSPAAVGGAQSLAQAELSVQTSNLTLLAVSGDHCSTVRLDSVTADRTAGLLSVTVERAALSAGRPATAPPLPCHKGAVLPEPVVSAARLRLRGRTDSELTVSIRETAAIRWSPTTHRHLKGTADCLRRWAALLRPPPATAAAAAPAGGDGGAGPRLSVRLRAELTVDAALSSCCRLGLAVSELSWSRDGTSVCLTAAAPRLLFDGHEVLVVRGLRAERSAQHRAAAARRAACEDLLLAQNVCWEVTMASLEGSAPYGYDLAEAWSEELLTTTRWLKRLHGRPSGSGADDVPLPPDLCIQIKQLSLEICDDPFEVKLRDNYELLEDEYHESVKRRQTLDQKIEEQRRRHGLLQARKVESLYSQLQQRDAQLFVQRAGQMYRTGTPMRTRLLLWSMESLELWALADPSLHGRAACVSQLRTIDPLSPWPDDEPAFSTLWCREMVISCPRWTVTLRDYPQPLLDVTQLHLWGRLVGAEQAAVARATRQLPVRLQPPFPEEQVDRSLMSLKFYYDFSSDVDHLVAAYGPCWEPAMAMFNLCLEKVLRPSTDPSPPLPWWDKTRLKMHGRATQSVRQMALLLHASLDPYNTTEEMELTFADLVMDWTDGKIVFKGDLSVYVRTASKYDDCRLLFVPGLKLAFKLDWLCMGDPRDHHTVAPCARDKLPEYSSNQEHDSYRAFRSQNLNMSVSIETRPSGGQAAVVPTMLLYGSTLRWFENLQFILSGMTRPTRRGAVFSNVRPRRVQLSRHYKCVRLSLNLHAFQVSYWMSFTRQHGLDIRGGRVSLSSEHRLTLRPVTDGLLHRPRACWAIEYLNCELNDAEVWLQSSLGGLQPPPPPPPVAAGPVEKWFFLSVARVSYGRAASVPDTTRDCPTHRLVVHNMKAAWTKNNRDAGFALFDSFTSNQQLKRNLSTAALKGFTFDSGSAGAARTPQKPPRAGSLDGAAAAAAAVAAGGLNSSLSASTPSPMSRLQSGQAATMLQKLIDELGAAPVAFSEDAAGGELDETALRGLAACHATDVLHNSWLVELVNCQVLLKGIETRGYVIITSSKSQVWQRLHRPVWRDRTLVSKTSWVGRLDGMQYYATVSAGHPAAENIMWLTVDNIEERDDDDIRDVPDLVGSGQSVGGVVTETVGAASADEHDSIQLQRVVSRCRCEFFYAGYGEVSVDPDSVESIPPLPSEPSQLWPGQEGPVDALTVTHHDLNVCTNSLQYAMVLDIVNNLLLYVAPRRRESSDQLQRMRFQMQLSALEDQRRPIQQLQNRCRAMMSEIRQLEKATYQLQRQREEVAGAADRVAAAAAAARLQAEMADKERQTLDKKEQLSASAEELAMRIHIYKETQLSKTPKPTARKGDAQQAVSVIRTAEVCIQHAQWRLTESDGQLGLADLIISNFQYTKHTKSDDSVEHLLELGYIRMSNLLPNPAYRDVLQPTDTQSGMPVERQRSLRVYFRERPPVGGISVKEHLEINVTPINIGMTYQFFKTMLRFCFPERDTEHLEEDVPAPKEKLSKKEKRKQKKESNFYVAIEKDDVEKMKERAQNNMLFIYIKVPEVTVRVSYKGEKEKNLEDVHNFLLTVPTLEYHNVTWTWLDLLLAMKNDSKRVLLSQAIKQKLQIGGGRGAAGAEEPLQDEEDKARLLFGSMMAPGSEKEKPTRKGFFHLHRS